MNNMEIGLKKEDEMRLLYKGQIKRVVLIALMILSLIILFIYKVLI